MNFPFGTNGKFIILGVPILKHIRVSLNSYCLANNITLMCLNIRKPKTIHFSFGINGKLMFLGVPILKQFG